VVGSGIFSIERTGESRIGRNVKPAPIAPTRIAGRSPI